MKRFTLTLVTLGVCLPLLAWAAVSRPNSNNGQNTNSQKPSQFGQNQNQNGSLGPKGEHSGPPTGQGLGAGLDHHIQMIQALIDHLDQSRIPDSKRAEVKQDLETELAWMQDMKTKIDAASTPEELTQLRQEIITHVQEVRANRQQKLSQGVQIPQTSPAEAAQNISTHFSQIESSLSSKGVDTTDLHSAIQEYDQAAADIQTAFSQVSGEKNYDNLVALRDQLSTVQEKAGVVRNLIQSLLTSLTSRQ